MGAVMSCCGEQAVVKSNFVRDIEQYREQTKENDNLLASEYGMIMIKSDFNHVKKDEQETLQPIDGKVEKAKVEEKLKAEKAATESAVAEASPIKAVGSFKHLMTLLQKQNKSGEFQIDGHRYMLNLDEKFVKETEQKETNAKTKARRQNLRLDLGTKQVQAQQVLSELDLVSIEQEINQKKQTAEQIPQKIVLNSSLDGKSPSQIKQSYSQLKASKDAIMQEKDKLEIKLQRLQSQIEQENVNRMSESIAPQSPDHLHIGFLHASPIFYMEKQQGRKSYQVPQPKKLEVMLECKTIKDTLKLTNQAIRFESKVATINNFLEMYARCMILHISCHGFADVKRSTSVDRQEEVRQEGNFLLFETDEGLAESISAKEIRDFVNKYENQPSVIVLAACTSEYIGKIFLKYGLARHVICIKDDTYLDDQAAILFAKTFYSKIFQGQERICEAFDQAVESVRLKFDSGEANQYKKLVQEEVKYEDAAIFGQQKKEKHICYKVKAIQRGNFISLSDHNLAEIIPGKMRKFSQCRYKQMYTALEHLIKKDECILSIVGIRGIGKSTLAINTQKFISERKICTSGNIYIDCKKYKSIYSLLKHMRRKLLNLMQMTTQERHDLVAKTCSQETLLEFVIAFITCHNDQKLKNCKKRSLQSRKLFLIVLDDIDEIIQNDNIELIKLLQSLESQCKDLKLILTSYSNVQCNVNNRFVYPLIVEKLSEINSVNLFFENVDYNAKNDEVIPLLFEDQNYPFELLLPSLINTIDKKQLTIDQLTEEQLVELKIKCNDDRDLKRALSYHDMFKQAHGNPFSIALMSSIYQNYENTQIVKQSPNRLIDLYKRISTEKSYIAIEEVSNFQTGQEHVVASYFNTCSLQVNIEMSIKLLKELNYLCEPLLYFLGCMPGGITLQMLKTLWDPQVYDYINNLRSLSMVEDFDDNQSLDVEGQDNEVEQTIIRLNPFMLSYTQATIEQRDKEKFMSHICHYYLNILCTIYKNINKITKVKSKQNEEEEDMFDLFNQTSAEIEHKLQAQMRNINFCIDYLLETESVDQRQKVNEKSQNPITEQKEQIDVQDQVIVEEQHKEEQSSSDEERKEVMKKHVKFSLNIQDSSKTFDSRQCNIYRHKYSKVTNNISQTYDARKHAYVNQNRSDPIQGQRRQSQISFALSNINNHRSESINPQICFNDKAFTNHRFVSEKNILAHSQSIQAGIGYRQMSSIKGHNQSLVKNVGFQDQENYSKAKTPKAKSPSHQTQSSIDVKHAKGINVIDREQIQDSSDDVETVSDAVVTDSDCDGFSPIKRNTSYQDTFPQIDKTQNQTDLASPFPFSQNLGYLPPFNVEPIYATHQAVPNQMLQPILKSHLSKHSEGSEVKRLDLGEGAIRLSSDEESYDDNDYIEDQSTFQDYNFESQAYKSQQNRRKSLRSQQSKSVDLESIFSADKNSLKKLPKHKLNFKSKKTPQAIKSSFYTANTDDLQRVSAFQEQSKVEEVWPSMSDYGLFFIMTIANTILSNDCGFSYKIVHDSKHSEDTGRLFESNNKRLGSLASLFLFQHENEQEDIDVIDNLNFLIEAIDMIREAKGIYKAKDIEGGHQNSHGIALCSFQLGYIYQEFAPFLGNSQIQQKYIQQYQSFYQGANFYDQLIECYSYAQKKYQKAFDHFLKVGHQEGMTIAQKRLATLFTDNRISALNEISQEQMAQHKAVTADYEQKLNDYCQQKGAKKPSGHIPRNNGEEISLMTEIVFGGTNQVSKDTWVETPLIPFSQTCSDQNDSQYQSFSPEKFRRTYSANGFEKGKSNLLINPQRTTPSALHQTMNRQNMSQENPELKADFSTQVNAVQQPRMRHSSSEIVINHLKSTKLFGDKNLEEHK